MKTIGYLLVLSIFFASCNSSQTPVTDINDPAMEKSDAFYHYSVWWAFVNLVFDGTLTAKELKTKGDIALGSYNSLEGELVMIDGKLLKVTDDGSVHEAVDEEMICYANATWFNADQSFNIDKPVNYDSLRALINKKLPSHNQFYGFRIHGTFDYMRCGGVPKQEKPYTKGLDELLPIRPVFEQENVTGTMVGFYCPQFIGNINVAGYHLHFVSEDFSFGGHVLDFNTSNLKVELDYITEYTFVLPETPEFLQGSFEKEFQYGTK